ncbi:hypothetical protein [Paraburkholderia sp. JHI869]|uniref:hypothetical protein n=1 Tax=Paraburkholderia sp. JHI869 TaxID=3112959 RepID=UPI003170CDF3
MKQTVIGVFDSYAQAHSAQLALRGAGVLQADMAIYSTSADAPVEKGPRVYAPGSGEVRHHKAMFDRLEQLFARLFKAGEYPPEADDYRQFVRRGGTLVSADVSEPQIDTTLDLMRRAGAADIGERADEWRNRPVDARTPGAELHRQDSASSDGSQRGADPAPQSHRTDEAARPRNTLSASNARKTTTGDAPASANAGMHGRAASSAAPKAADKTQQATTRTEHHGSIPWGYAASQEAGAPEAGATRGALDDNPKSGSAKAEPPSGYAGDPNLGAPLPKDEAHESELRKDYEAHYASTGASYDEYRRAYTHGATLGQEERYRGSDWTGAEQSLRETWESRYPENRWERFKAAVRYGWDRVRGGY